MRKNSLKQKMLAGEGTTNGWCAFGSSYSAEILGHAGFDSVTVDMQHGMFDFNAVLPMLQALSATPAVPIVRVPWNDTAIIMHALDAGAYGIICPMVNNRADAERLVAACRYAPVGMRSYGPARGLLYGGPDYFDHANDEILVLAMIETLEGMKNLDEILATHPTLAPRFAGATRLGAVKGFGLPLGSKRRALSGAGYCLLGDAGSLIDPFSGEGISHAMVSGRHAAIWAVEAVKKADFSPEFLQHYDKAVYNRLGQELRLSRVMQRLLNFPSLFNIIANRAVNNPTLAETLSMMFMDLDLRERLRKPSFYFKLFFGGK